MERVVKKETATFTDFLRARFKGVIEPVAGFLNRMGMLPNTATMLGLFGVVIGAYFLAVGNMLIGGIVIFVSVLFDALDGTMARLRGEPTSFGGFVDSVSDRYAEIFIFGGLLIFFLQHQDWLGAGLSYLAAAGSLLVSYTRARAQAVGFETKVGILSRVERFIILVPCLLINQPLIAVGAIALFANITALQRIFHVRKQAYEKMNSAEKK